MAYNPTNWVNDITPINAANLNKIERQLVENANIADANQKNIDNIDKHLDDVESKMIKEVSNINGIDKVGIFKTTDELITSSKRLWNTDLSIPFKYIGDGAIPELNFNRDTSSIINGGSLEGIPLLRYVNLQGHPDEGGTYIFLGLDNETFKIYVQDINDNEPWEESPSPISFIGDDIIDLSRLTSQEIGTIGLGEDICGNWALISKYFVETGLDINKVVTDNCVANALKGNKTGEAVVLADISPLGHELKVKVSGVTDLSSVTVRQQGKNILPYPYYETTKTINGVTFTDNGSGSITVNGTATVFTTFYFTEPTVDISDLFVDGGTYVINDITLPTGNTINIVLDVIDKSTNNASYIYRGQSFTVDKSKYLYRGFRIQMGAGWSADNVVVYPQLELGTTPTEYEPYISPITASVNASGTVRGLKSIYPTTTLTTDTKSAIINVEYNKDINKSGVDEEQIIEETTKAVVNEIGDKVVAQGKSGIWSYRRWGSGLAECWGHITFNSTVDMESGALYLSPKIVDAQAFPFTFKEVPMVNATIGGAQYMAFLMVAGMSGDAVTTTHSGKYRIARSTVAPAESPFVINYDVKGYWK